LEKTRIAIIGGTGFDRLFNDSEQTSVETPYGTVQALFPSKIENKRVTFLPRHGVDHSVPPHKVNYRAHIFALHKIGVERILATNAVGAINRDLEPGETVVPNDFIDFTKLRSTTFYDEAPVTHVDVSQPYCPEIRNLLIANARKNGLHVWDKAILVCTEGPRYETPAEIAMFRHLGCDIVGMTGYPEAVLARELEMCYASICYVSNRAAGMQQRLTAREVAEVSKKALPKIEQVLIDTIRELPPKREGNCPCANALRNARFE